MKWKAFFKDIKILAGALVLGAVVLFLWVMASLRKLWMDVRKGP